MTFSGSPQPSTPYLLVPGALYHTDNVQVILRACVLLSLSVKPGSFPLMFTAYLWSVLTDILKDRHSPNHPPGAIRCLVNAVAWWHVFTTVVMTVFFLKISILETDPSLASWCWFARFPLGAVPKSFCRRVSKQTMWREVGRAGVWTLNVALWWKYRAWCQKFRV